MPIGYGVGIPGPFPRRFYATVGVAAEGDGFIILLDDRPLHTPGGVLLAVTSCPLANAIAAEWQAQDDRIHPANLPLTQLTNIAIDRINLIPALRQQMLDALLVFAATDLVCYRATTPPVLAERQQVQWQPLLDWVARSYGASLRVTTGVMPVPQSPVVLATLRVAIAEMDSLRLAALYRAAALCSSLVIALALVKGKIDAGMAFAAAQLDVLFQAEHWGVDTAAAARQDTLHAELHLLARFIALLEPMQPRTT